LYCRYQQATFRKSRTFLLFCPVLHAQELPCTVMAVAFCGSNMVTYCVSAAGCFSLHRVWSTSHPSLDLTRGCNLPSNVVWDTDAVAACIPGFRLTVRHDASCPKAPATNVRILRWSAPNTALHLTLTIGSVREHGDNEREWPAKPARPRCSPSCKAVVRQDPRTVLQPDLQAPEEGMRLTLTVKGC
jgi:hypothetical protein